MTDLRSLPHRLPWRRSIPLVLVPLLLAASYFPGEYRVPAVYWVMAMTAAAVFLLGERAPLPTSIVLSALAAGLFSQHAWGLAGLVPYLGAVGLAEAAMRIPRRIPITVAGLCWTAAVVVGLATESSPFWRTATAVEAIAVVGLPLLLGLYLRAQHELAETYRVRAAEAAELARTEERTALARELHDLVAHHMASIVLRVGIARHVDAAADPQVRAVLDDVHGTASGALTDIRRFLTALRDPELGDVALVEPDAVPGEITAAIDRTRGGGFIVDLAPLPSLTGLDAVGRLTLLRVVQESLTNVMKHADPGGRVTVVIASADRAVSVDIASSLPAAAARNPAGSRQGLVGMTERTVIAGGSLDAGPHDGKWHVHAWLPTEIEGNTP